jgi:hypothetical protein
LLFGDSYSKIGSSGLKKGLAMERLTNANPFKKGDVLVSCWGYGQTNVDFFLVTRTTSKSVWLILIKHQGVDKRGRPKRYSYKDGEGLCAPIQPPVIIKDRDLRFSLKRREARKSLIFHRNKPCVINPKTDCAIAYKWDGKPVRESWYY